MFLVNFFVRYVSKQNPNQGLLTKDRTVLIVQKNIIKRMNKQHLCMFIFTITQPVFVIFAIKHQVLISLKDISKNVLRIGRQPNMNNLQQCECIIKKDFASSRQCNKCFIILCQSCKSDHQDCNQPNYQNCIAKCKREQCQALIKQDQLVTHALKCEFRERKCYNTCGWQGIQRDYKNHAEHCFRVPTQFQRESTRLFQFEFYQIQSQKRYIQFKTNKALKQNLHLRKIQFQLQNQ